MITRCPSCRTAFKVVPDQLRIAAGWVRCGHCGELFDGQAHLVSSPAPHGVAATAAEPIEPVAESASSDAPRWAWARPPDIPLDSDDIGIEADFQPTTLLAPGDRLADASAVGETPTLADADAEGTGAEEPSTAPSEPSPEPPPRPAGAPVADPFLDDLPAFLGHPSEPRFRADDTDAADPFEAPPPVDLELDPAPARHAPALDPYPFASPRAAPLAPPESHAREIPSFIRRAQAHPLWDHAAMRAALWAALVVLVVALAAQWLQHERNWLAARFPTLQGTLTVLCQPLGCSVEPYRMLDAIAIDGSDFKALDAHTFRFDLSVRNNADVPVAMPSFQLTLSNLRGQVLVRRVISAAELDAPVTLKARGEFDATRALRISSAAQPESITSYRVVAFYR